MRYSEFLAEGFGDEDKLKHLEHNEDHVINHGKEGFKHAFHNLEHMHHMLKGSHNHDSTATVKYDGSPAVIFGHHPENGKFFVATKSAFNKTPKINHTHKDIDANHGHAPGLAHKLKLALKHLPKITPKGKIYQADIMHAKDIVQKKGNHLHFKPNTIDYSVHKDSKTGKAIAKSHIGVAVHTEYKGKSINGLRAHYNADLSHLHKHSDVHVISPHHDFHSNRGKYTDAHSKEYTSHMRKATSAFQKTHNDAYKHLEQHRDHIKAYINHTVRNNTRPTVAGYAKHYKDKMVKKQGTYKTDKKRAEVHSTMQKHRTLIARERQHLKNIFDMHHHLTNAKDHLVKHFSNHKQPFRAHVGGKGVKPEGVVINRGGRPTKMVDRKEFSRLNFLNSRG